MRLTMYQVDQFKVVNLETMTHLNRCKNWYRKMIRIILKTVIMTVHYYQGLLNAILAVIIDVHVDITSLILKWSLYSLGRSLIQWHDIVINILLLTIVWCHRCVYVIVYVSQDWAVAAAISSSHIVCNTRFCTTIIDEYMDILLDL